MPPGGGSSIETFNQLMAPQYLQPPTQSATDLFFRQFLEDLNFQDMAMLGKREAHFQVPDFTGKSSFALTPASAFWMPSVAFPGGFSLQNF